MKLPLKLIVLAASVTASAVVGPQAEDIRRTLTAGTTDIYKVEEQENRVISSDYFDEMEFNTNRRITVKVATGEGAASEKGIDATVTETVDDQIMEPSDGLDAKPDPVTLKGTLDERGHFAFDGERATLQESLTRIALSPIGYGVLGELPNHPVRIGDTWEVPAPIRPEKGEAEQKLTIKLEGEGNVLGRPAWKVATTGPFTIKTEQKIKLQLSGRDLDQTNTTVQKGSVEGVTWIEKATGKTLKSKTKIQKRVEISFSTTPNSKLEGKYSTTFETTLVLPK